VSSVEQTLHLVKTFETGQMLQMELHVVSLHRLAKLEFVFKMRDDNEK